MNKKEMRKKFTELRNNIENRERKDRQILENLKNLEIYKNAKTIFIFVSYKSEVNTRDIINMILEDDKKVYVPFVDGDEMIAVEIKSLDSLKPNKMGILEPEVGESKRDIDLTITPGLAFDKKGYRLGYGGGYYDKFFAIVETIKMGIAYWEQIVEEIPHEDYDKKLDFLITDKGLVKFNE